MAAPNSISLLYSCGPLQASVLSSPIMPLVAPGSPLRVMTGQMPRPHSRQDYALFLLLIALMCGAVLLGLFTGPPASSSSVSAGGLHAVGPGLRNGEIDVGPRGDGDAGETSADSFWRQPAVIAALGEHAMHGDDRGGSAKGREGSRASMVYSMPHFLIVGVQKCGTSALYFGLCAHPNITCAAY